MLDNWYLGETDANCKDTCASHSLECSEKAFYKKNGDVDSSDELLSVITKLGGNIPTKACTKGSKGFVPLSATWSCAYSDSSRSQSTFDCEASPTSGANNKKTAVSKN